MTVVRKSSRKKALGKKPPSRDLVANEKVTVTAHRDG